MKKHIGFTLVELMITLFIVSVLLTVGIPSMKTLMKGNQLVAASNELVSAFHLARSEAIKLNARVSICESSDGANCSATGSWDNGWIVFVDSNSDLLNTGAPCAAIGTDCLLRIHDGYADSDLVITGLYDSTAAAATSFTFTSRGIPKTVVGASQSGVFSVCSLSAGTTIDSRAVILGLSGRVRVSDNAAVITCP